MAQRSKRQVQDRYQLLEPLGRGGMGVVWLAEDSLLQRKVAVKEVELPAGLTADEAESMRARVMREARAAARLNHPNVTTVYDVVSADDTTWIVMEYVAAPTLAEIVSRHGPLSVRRTAEIGLDVLSALDAAHAAGIIHRDVKPSNVMVPEHGNVKLADFGVAAVQGDPKITMTGLIIGSPSYMSPEQAKEGVSTTASDMWGLGTTLYFAVEGRLAFDKGAAIPTLTAVTYEPPEPMQRAGELQPVVQRLLEKDPDQRLTAGELRGLLEEIASDHPGTAGRPPATTTVVLNGLDAGADDAAPADDGWAGEPRIEGRRSPWPWVFAALLLLLVGGFALRSLLAPTDDPGAENADSEAVADESSGQTRSGDDTGTTDEATGSTADDRAAEDTAAGATGDGDATSDEARDDAGTTGDVVVPEDWTTFAIGDTGSTVAHPPEWSLQDRSATVTDIVDPNGGRYLRVDHTDTPRDDAVATWREHSEGFAANHDNYRELGIEPYPYEGAETAALWEYTYTEGGADLHAYNLAIVIGGHGYALNFQTREAQWAESQQLWEQFVAGFDPAT